jgi:prevent-host-death family protein
MESRISATEAARSFSELLNRVRDGGEEFIVERGGQPICRIVPARPVRATIADFVRFLQEGPKPDPAYWDDVQEAINNQGTVPESRWEP